MLLHCIIGLARFVVQQKILLLIKRVKLIKFVNNFRSVASAGSKICSCAKSSPQSSTLPSTKQDSIR